jgi:trypsin
MTARRLLSPLVLTLALLPATAVSAQESAPDGEIIGGDHADPGEYPFQVALLQHAVATRSNAQFCGGTLISPDTVLTAGHCVVGAAAADIDILAGTNSLSPGGGGTRVRARRIRLHPGYDDVTLEHDVAVIQLGQDLPYGLVRPAVPGDLGLYPAGTMATTIGWGDRDIARNTQDYPFHLREVEVPIVSDVDCATAYPVGLFPGVVCAGDLVDGGEDSCYGDSGGPLLVPEGPDWVQMGIVSTGTDCARRRFPGIYTEVAAYAFVQRYLDPDSVPDPVSGLRRRAAFGAGFLDWDAPFFDGGTAIVRYRVDLPGLGRSLSVPGSRTDAVLRNVPTGRHLVQVRAVNEVGLSTVRGVYLTV